MTTVTKYLSVMQSEIHNDDAIDRLLLGLRCNKVEVKDICGGREMPRDYQLGEGNLKEDFFYRLKI